MRRVARETALQLMYLLDVQQVLGQEGQSFDDAVDTFFRNFEDIQGDEAEFCRRLVAGVHRELPRIDEAIGHASTHWRLERMEVVDRNLLRLAAFELGWCADIPTAVTINEALEITKRFNGKHAVSFVNGVLDQLAQTFGAVEEPE